MSSEIIYEGYVVKKPTACKLGKPHLRYLVLYADGAINYYENLETFQKNVGDLKGQVFLKPNSEVKRLTPNDVDIKFTFRQHLSIHCEKVEHADAWYQHFTKCLERLKINPKDRRSGFISSFYNRKNVTGTEASMASTPSANTKTIASKTNVNVITRVVDFEATSTVQSEELEREANLFCQLIWNNDIDGVNDMLLLNPVLGETPGHVIDESTGQMIRSGIPAALAAEKGFEEILSLLLQYTKPQDLVRVLTRQSLVSGGKKWVAGNNRVTFGMMPSTITMDPSLRKTFAHVQLEAVLKRKGRLTPLEEKYFDLMVDRVGETKDAFMVCYSVVEEICRGDKSKILMDPKVGPRLVVISRADSETKTSALRSLLEEFDEDEDEEIGTQPTSSVDIEEEHDKQGTMKDYLEQFTEQYEYECPLAFGETVTKEVPLQESLLIAKLVNQEFKQTMITNAVTSGVHGRAISFLEVPYAWNLEQKQEVGSSNIFGENSYIVCDFDVLNVPVNDCTEENLLYFNCLLLDANSPPFEFEIPRKVKEVPLTSMGVGKDYVPGYIMKEQIYHCPEGVSVEDPDAMCEVVDGGGGAYLEWHDNPHFHMPVSKDAEGYLIVGKLTPHNTLHVGAFQIPYGKAVYMRPYTMHNDCFLVGDYHVVYAGTDNYATGTLINRKNKLCEFDFFCPMIF